MTATPCWPKCPSSAGTSVKTSAIKPEPAIYEAALREIGCDPGECFYTDDIPKYVTAGRQHGLLAEVFTDVPALLGHLGQCGVAVTSPDSPRL